MNPSVSYCRLDQGLLVLARTCSFTLRTLALSCQPERASGDVRTRASFKEIGVYTETDAPAGARSKRTPPGTRMDASEIRRRFLDHFVRYAHLEVASAPLVAPGDPTLLFTSAGMVPFKPYFLGQAAPPRPRLASIQKCFRTTDIDEVGDDSHLTFFEMLGNFSFGDYFKAEAQAFAWELVTQELGIPADRLVTTIFHDDEEAFEGWRKLGVPASKIYRYGKAEGNYWSAGIDGPCGPCSEIYYDFGPETDGDQDSEPRDETGRYLEIWNLVFMQFLQGADGGETPLPTKNIDTGAGLERWAMVMQGKHNVYETDLFAPLLTYIAGRCGREYASVGADDQRALRVVAEHGRAMTFLAADGVLPSNEGRGYVLRRLIRRALYMAHTLGINDALLPDVAAHVRERMGQAYPEIQENAALVAQVLGQEEERFRRTLATGQRLLDEQILPDLARAGNRIIPGDTLFRLYDTYGFPPDLTREIAARAGFSVDEAGFEVAMAEQRARGRATAEFRVAADDAAYAEIGGASTFLGYGHTAHPASVVALVRDGQRVDEAALGAPLNVVLDQTPFYPEGGGQVGDVGRLVWPEGELRVDDTQAYGDLIAHRGEVVRGTLRVGNAVRALVDGDRRRDTMRNHTATHLLHAALREVLGDHVRQGGSLVAPDRFRFDYTQSQAPRDEQLAEVQRLIRTRIREDLPVGADAMSFEEAVASGAMAIFGEKYGADVRVVHICDPDPAVHDCFSKELCGGTHAPTTGYIGAFQIIAEGSVGAGLRRIEALTGAAADAWREKRLQILTDVADSLRVAPVEVPARLAALQSELDDARRQLAAVERQAGAGSAERLVDLAQEVDGVRLVVGRVDAASTDALRQIGDAVRQRLGSGVIVLGAVAKEKPVFVAMVSEDLVASGLHAGKLIKDVAAVAGGGGGGRPEIAQAGGRDAARLDAALATAVAGVRSQRSS